ncbi:MAG: hypothetical protein RR197_04805, partial [Oscillospiraceae bacterium]
MLTELAHRQGCLLLTVDVHATVSADATLIAGLALLYDAMIALIDYSDGAERLLEALLDWFSVLLMTTGDRACNFSFVS